MNYWLPIILIGVVAAVALFVLLRAIAKELNQVWVIIKDLPKNYKQYKAESMTKNVAKDSDVDDDAISK